MENYWGTGRTEAFSDGVFAIAITLLILEVNVPETAFDNLWRGILDQWPSYLAYATSFITIGGIWLAHHGIFRRLQYANTRLMLINLLLLDGRLVPALPDQADGGSDPQLRRRAGRSHLLRRHAARHLVTAQRPLGIGITRPPSAQARGDEKEFNAIALAAGPNIGFYVGVIVLAIFAPRVAAVGYLLVAVVAVLRARGDRSSPPTTAPA